MEIIEGSHQTFHSDGWQQIEAINTPPESSDTLSEHTEDTVTFQPNLDGNIAEVLAQAEALEVKGEDPSFAFATAQYLRALKESYRVLQATEPHLTPELTIEMGESRACRELCSIAAQHDTPTPIDKLAVELATGNVNWNAIPIGEANELFDSLVGFHKTTEDALAQQETSWSVTSDSPVHALLNTVPTRKMQELFLHTDIDGSPSSFARYIDAEATSESQLVKRAKFFLLATEPEHGLEEMKHHPVIGRLIDKLGGTEAAKIVTGEAILQYLPELTVPEGTPAEPEKIDLHNRRYERAIQEYLLTDVGLSRELIASISDAMKSRLQSPMPTSMPDTDDTTTPDTTTPTSVDMVYQRYPVLSAMLRIGENVRTLGAESIERLHSELGVTNLDRYSPEDLQTMVKLLDNDPATIENLQNGDVMTIMSDTYGDWNGAFNSSLDNVRRDTGRSLLFEVSKPSDFYRHMIFLKQRGIKPSSLSINAHGMPGLTHFGAGSIGSGFFLAAGWIEPRENEDTEKNNLDVSLFQANLPRLFSDEFFQPSRGIDDAADWVGSTQVIINSCSSDVSNEEWTYSTAETIARRVARTEDAAPLSVIGASDVLYVQNSPEGLRFIDKDGNGIGVKIDAKMVSPARQNKILSALKRQKAEELQTRITRTSYAVIPTSNTFRKVA